MGRRRVSVCMGCVCMAHFLSLNSCRGGRTDVTPGKYWNCVRRWSLVECAAVAILTHARHAIGGQDLTSIFYRRQGHVRRRPADWRMVEAIAVGKCWCRCVGSMVIAAVHGARVGSGCRGDREAQW